MTINQRQFALLTAMDIPLWCDKSRAKKVVKARLKSVLNVTPDKVSVANDKIEARYVDIQSLCKQPIFQDILLCLQAIPADVSALPSSEHEQNIKIKDLSWQFSSVEKIALDNKQLQSPSLAAISNNPMLKKALSQQLSQLN